MEVENAIFDELDYFGKGMNWIILEKGWFFGMAIGKFSHFCLGKF